MSEKDELLQMTRRLRIQEERIGRSRWQPAADVYRTPEGWLVKFELAGVREEEFDIHLSGRHLLLRGRRIDQDVVEGCCFHRLEIAYSRFERHIELPEAVKRPRLVTEHSHGMLLVRIIEEAPGP